MDQFPKNFENSQAVQEKHKEKSRPRRIVKISLKTSLLLDRIVAGFLDSVNTTYFDSEHAIKKISARARVKSPVEHHFVYFKSQILMRTKEKKCEDSTRQNTKERDLDVSSKTPPSFYSDEQLSHETSLPCSLVF